MMLNKTTATIVAAIIIITIGACSQKNPAIKIHRDIINIDNAADALTLDPQLVEETRGIRVVNDLFEGLTSFNQKNQIIPGLAEKWEISPDGKTYTFYLRPGIKFSDGTSITSDDVIFSFQRLVDPKTASLQSYISELIVNGTEIIKGKIPPNKLGIIAIDDKTLEIKLIRPDPSFLEICSLGNLAIVSKNNVIKFGQQWSNPENMVTSGAYKLDEWVIKGHILLSKNPFYYDKNRVSIEKVKFLPIEDANSAFNHYKSGSIDIADRAPIDQYKIVKSTMPDQLKTVKHEALYYYNINMLSPKLKDNQKLRQALSMAVNREILVNNVLGQEQIPSYSYATVTIDSGQFANSVYSWSKLPRNEQVSIARNLFANAGYNQNNPLKITIKYNNQDIHKKVAIAVSSMWKEIFGQNAIVVELISQEWTTFIETRKNGNFEIARDRWNANHNSITTYTDLHLCQGNQNRAKYCNSEYDKLISKARQTTDLKQRNDFFRQALKIAMDDYPIIPLFQNTYFRLVNPQVMGYASEHNYLDRVMSKWFSFK